MKCAPREKSSLFKKITSSKKCRFSDKNVSQVSHNFLPMADERCSQEKSYVIDFLLTNDSPLFD
jgi:hypothetical protein